MMRDATAVIFDMDGVIVDSEPLHERAFLNVFAEIGFAETHGVDFPSYYGKSDRIVWQDFIERHQPSQSFEFLLGRKETHFTAMLECEQPIFPGVTELLSMAGHSFRIGLASGSRRSTIDSVLALKGLRTHFQAVVSSQDVENGKPAPDIFVRTASLLGVAPSECWVIEDSEAGVEAGLAAGMRVIGITNSLPESKLARAHHVVSDYQQVAHLLKLGNLDTDQS